MENEVFVGGEGPDLEFRSEHFIYGINGDDTLIGESDGHTQIYGGEGGDRLAYTGASTAKLYGEDGDDQLDGGANNDLLSGGDGADLFAFVTILGADNVDRIVDFEPGVDHIAVTETSMPAVGTKISKGEFREGSSAKDKSDHILYDAKHGKLFYDEDGKGGAGKVLFATIQKNLDIDHHDFQVLL